MGGHSIPNEGISKIWLTPPELIEALGSFDLDPCAAPSPRPWPTAKKHIEPPEDGLLTKWEGRVFLNPPYTQAIGAWLNKLAEHQDGIALIFARTETAIWHKYVWGKATAIFFFNGRLFFHRPDGQRASSNAGAPSVLVAYNAANTIRIAEAGLNGVLINLAETVLPSK